MQRPIKETRYLGQRLYTVQAERVAPQTTLSFPLWYAITVVPLPKHATAV